MASTITGKGLRKPVSLVHATGIVTAAALVSAIFGLLREMLVASRFGTSVATDAYFFSYGLIVSLPVFLLAAIAAGLVPVYTRSKAQGQSDSFVSTVINVYLLFLLAVAALAMVTAPYTIAALASGLDTAGQQIATQMVRLLSPVIVFVGLWGVFRALLDAEGGFFLSTISQALLSLGVIGAVLLFSPQLGIYSLPLGILVGSVAQAGWTGYGLAARKAFQYKLTIDLHDPRFRRLLTLLGPGLLGGAIGYTSQLVDTAFASHLAAGSIASLGFALRPMALLTRIAVYSFVTALLPTLSREAIHSSPDSFRATVASTLGIIMFVTIPLSTFLAVLSVPIIQVLFERGEFVATSTAGTAAVFACLVIGLMPMAVAVTLSTVFASLEDTKTPAIFGAGTNFVANVIFDLLLIGFLGVVGIALATSLKYVVSSTVLLQMLRRRLPGIHVAYLTKTLGKTLVASLLAAGPVFLLVMYSGIPSIILIPAGMVLGTALFWFFSLVFRVPELMIVSDYLGKLKDRVNPDQLSHEQ